MTFPSGKRLGPYEIVAPIGAGGMGEVYKATDTRLDRTVAIKVLPEEVAQDPERRERLARAKRSSFETTPFNSWVRLLERGDYGPFRSRRGANAGGINISGLER